MKNGYGKNNGITHSYLNPKEAYCGCPLTDKSMHSDLHEKRNSVLNMKSITSNWITDVDMLEYLIFQRKNYPLSTINRPVTDVPPQIYINAYIKTLSPIFDNYEAYALKQAQLESERLINEYNEKKQAEEDLEPDDNESENTNKKRKQNSQSQNRSERRTKYKLNPNYQAPSEEEVYQNFQNPRYFNTQAERRRGKKVYTPQEQKEMQQFKTSVAAPFFPSNTPPLPQLISSENRRESPNSGNLIKRLSPYISGGTAAGGLGYLGYNQYRRRQERNRQIPEDHPELPQEYYNNDDNDDYDNPPGPGNGGGIIKTSNKRPPLSNLAEEERKRNPHYHDPNVGFFDMLRDYMSNPEAFTLEQPNEEEPLVEQQINTVVENPQREIHETNQNIGLTNEFTNFLTRSDSEEEKINGGYEAIANEIRNNRNPDVTGGIRGRVFNALGNVYDRVNDVGRGVINNLNERNNNYRDIIQNNPQGLNNTHHNPSIFGYELPTTVTTGLTGLLFNPFIPK